MDRFDAMQAFARVVETGCFTKAAGELHYCTRHPPVVQGERGPGAWQGERLSVRKPSVAAEVLHA